jgi:hypothetical protein
MPAVGTSFLAWNFRRMRRAKLSYSMAEENEKGTQVEAVEEAEGDMHPDLPNVQSVVVEGHCIAWPKRL